MIAQEVRTQARALLFAMELGSHGHILRELLARLLTAFGDMAPTAPLSPEQACKRLLSHMEAAGAIQAGVRHQLEQVNRAKMQAVASRLDGRMPVASLQIETARLYTVVLCLARVEG